MPSSQQTLTLETWRLELVVSCTFQVKQRYNPFKPNLVHRSSLCIQHTVTVFPKYYLSSSAVYALLAMPSSLPRFFAALTPSLSLECQKVRHFSARRTYLLGDVEWNKQNSSKRLSAGKINGALNCVRSSFGRADESAQQARSAKPRCIISTFFKLKNFISMAFLAQAIDFFFKALIEILAKIFRLWSNAAQYQQMQRAFASEEIRRNHILDNIHNLGSEKRRTALLLNCCAKSILDFTIATNYKLRCTMLVI